MEQPLWIKYVDGVPIRPLANELKLSPAKVFRKIRKEMDALPTNNWLTATYCNRWSGILNTDGKYIKAKGYKKKIPFIYGIDFLIHDLPIGLLAPSENETAFLKYFYLLKQINYPLQIVICDDISPLKIALLRVYPKAKIQLCLTHYVENIRQNLRIKTEEKYQTFFKELMINVFINKDNLKIRINALGDLYEKYAKQNVELQYILIDIYKRHKELFAYLDIQNCPRTNNIIESFNSHLQARLKSIKGFQSFHSAERWLNAWMLRRRTKPYTDCQGIFKKYNGKIPLEISIKKQAKWPKFYGFQEPEMKR